MNAIKNLFKKKSLCPGCEKKKPNVEFKTSLCDMPGDVLVCEDCYNEICEQEEEEDAQEEEAEEESEEETEEEEEESEEEAEEDEEVEEILVEKIEVNGKIYYKDEKNVIYDVEEEERVGLWDEKENCVVFDLTDEDVETSDYMNELITCSKCEVDVKRQDLSWKAGGCAYTDVCKLCKIFEQEDAKEKEKIEPNSRCDIAACRNIFTEIEKGQLVTVENKSGRPVGLGFICVDCFKKKGDDASINYSEM